MICTERIAEIVECARGGGKPGPALDTHLAICAECNERWKAECELTSHFRVMRIHALARRPERASNLRGHLPDRFPDRRGEMLMREFAREFAHRNHRAGAPSWQWMLAAAAALLLAIGLGRELGHRAKRAPVQPSAFTEGATHGAHQPDVFMYEASADAGALSSDDFIAVPYAAPLATGEIVRVVRTDLYPEALASLGIDVNPAWSGDMAADVVVGQDGFPRAVRLAESAQF